MNRVSRGPAAELFLTLAGLLLETWSEQLLKIALFFPSFFKKIQVHADIWLR